MKHNQKVWKVVLVSLLAFILVLPSPSVINAVNNDSQNDELSSLATPSSSWSEPVITRVSNTSSSSNTGPLSLSASSAPVVTAKAGASTIKLSWSKDTSATKYHIYRYNDNTGKYVRVASTSTTSYTDNNVVPNVTYRYYVNALVVVDGKNVITSTSDILSVTTPIVSGPPSMIIYPAGRNSIMVTWDMGQNADGYVLRRATSASGPFENIVVTADRTYTDNNLASETKYYYDVIAYKVLDGVMWFAPSLCVESATTSNYLAAHSTAGFNVNRVVGLDPYWNRAITPINGYIPNRSVGIFYSPWFGEKSFTMNDIYDMEKILAQKDGDKILFHQDVPESPANEVHYWSEPLWGYYHSRDPYVIRRHIELLTIAGVNFLLVDATNAWTYSTAMIDIMRIMDEMQREGWDTPKVVFYTHSHSLATIHEVFDKIYSRGLYPNTWFYFNGKPLIVGYTEPEPDLAEAHDRGDYDYTPPPLTDLIKNFFSFARPQWPTEEVYADGFPWIEWVYPQPLHTYVMNVSAASHPQLPFSFSVSASRKDVTVNWGRGYNVTTGKNDAFWGNYGLFFQSQWDTVLNSTTKPEIVTVTGWNEWVAAKNMYDGEYAFVDLVNTEYSRDIEMMKGGHADNFYQQLIRNVRAYRGVSAGSTGYINKTVNIYGNVSQWDNVNAVFRDIGVTPYGRNYYNAAKTAKYVQAAPRNNLQEVRVTKDANYIYFYIRCSDNITSPSGTEWMNIFINEGTPASNTGWQGFNYVINRSVSGNTATIESISGDYSSNGITGSASINITGPVLQVKVPRSAVGLSNSNTFYFRIADNIDAPADSMDYYVSGSSLPLGRLSFQYND